MSPTRTVRGAFLGLDDVEIYAPGTDGEAARVARTEARIGEPRRRSGFVPEWRPVARDPGLTLTTLFASMLEPVGTRARALPEKARVELLRTAGIEPLAATPARAMVAFQVDPAATDPVFVAQGQQVGGRPPGGQDLVVFETERGFVATAGKLAEVQAVHGHAARNVTAQNDDASVSFQPFGLQPKVGDSLLLGIDADVAPAGTLCLGVGVTAPRRAPRAQSEGALYPLPLARAPQLSFDVLDGARWRSVSLAFDETQGLQRTGVLELVLPPQFRPGRPAVLGDGPAQYFVRVQLVAGTFARPVEFDFVRLNAVWASAGTTVRDEEVVPPELFGVRHYRLRQAPVVDGSLELMVDEGGGDLQPWRRVPLLEDEDGDARVFVVDLASGELTFGDGEHGRPLPDGARVIAKHYRAITTGVTSVAAHGLKTLLGSPPGVQGVDNPHRAAGGDPVEGLTETARRGPELIRTRGRSVLPADYELLALRTPGARVRRVHAMPGLHPTSPRHSVPGLVGLLVVPPDEHGNGLPPLPDEESLRNVARYVSGQLAPAGVEIVAGAPTYHSVRVEAVVVFAAGVDQGAAFTELLTRISRWLHPLTGGDDGQGWPFGGTLHYEALLRQLLSSPSVSRVPRLSYVVDGRRAARCGDWAIGAHELFWPVSHLLLPAEEAR